MNKLTAKRCREQFEEWGKSQRCELDKWVRGDKAGEYKNPVVAKMWQAWKASRVALPVLEQQGGWISCSERMPPSKTGVLVGCWYGYEWATKWATLIHVHPDASNEGWLMPGASWVPTHWHELPAPPQPTADTTSHVDNGGWIEWGGGEIPVDESARVELKWSHGGPIVVGRAGNFGWSNRIAQGFHSIIAYRVVEQQERERGEE